MEPRNSSFAEKRRLTNISRKEYGREVEDSFNCVVTFLLCFYQFAYLSKYPEENLDIDRRRKERKVLDKINVLEALPT